MVRIQTREFFFIQNVGSKGVFPTIKRVLVGKKKNWMENILQNERESNLLLERL